MSTAQQNRGNGFQQYANRKAVTSNTKSELQHARRLDAI